MITTRKRVAKRLASGLLAGALALGGLAISGGSVSAKTPSSPTTNRIAGADRYETATKLARDLNDVSAGLVIVSGESPWDALAAAPLTTASRPMLLVRKDSIPETVADFISDYKTGLISGQPRIYVVGGTAAVSDEVASAIGTAATTAGDTTPPLVTRISGEDRYGTAKAVAARTEVTSAGDTMILVNGNSWADAVSASFVAASLNWPIVLVPGAATGNGKDAIDAYIALAGGSPNFVIVGGTAVMPTSIDEYLVGEGIAPADIRRIGGADRYQTSLLMNVWTLSGGNGKFAPYTGASIALVSGEAPWDALASAGWSAFSGAGLLVNTINYNPGVHVLLTPTAGGNAFVNAAASTLSTVGTGGNMPLNSSLFVIGGKSAVSETAKLGYVAAATNDLTSSVVACAEGSSLFVVAFSGALTTPEQGWLNDADLASQSQAQILRRGNTNETPALVVQVTDSVYAFALVNPLVEGETIALRSEVDGGAQNVFASYRSIAGTSCTVANDNTEPTGTLRAVRGSSVDHLILTTSEPLASNNVTVSVANSASLVTFTSINSTGTQHMATVSGGNAVGVVAEIPAGALMDLSDADGPAGPGTAGNTNSSPIRTAFANDTTATTFTVGTVVCEASAPAVFTRGNLTVSASATSTLGANGNAYTMTVVNQRGLVLPRIAVDATAKTITVTADTGYHTVADVKTAAQNVWLEDFLLGGWEVGGDLSGLLSATTTVVRSTAGESECVVPVTGNEPFTQNNAAVSIAGFGAPLVGNPMALDGTALDLDAAAYTDALTGMAFSRAFVITTKVMGAGFLTFPAGANGLFDHNGNPFLGTIPFTAS